MSLKEKAKGLLTCRRHEYAAGGLGGVYFHSISFSPYKIKFDTIMKFN